MEENGRLMAGNEDVLREKLSTYKGWGRAALSAARRGMGTKKEETLLPAC